MYAHALFSHSRRWTGWTWAGLYTTAAQGFVQLFGFIAGILVVRTLSPREYAYYTIVTAGLGTMTVLTDGGVASGVLAQGGAVWQDRARLGRVIATGMWLRMRMSIVAVGIGLPMMATLLRHQGASWVEASLVAASILPVFLATVSGHLLEIAPRLHQALAPLQRIQVGANAARAALIAIAVPVWPSAAVVSILTALPQWWGNWRTRRLAARFALWRSSCDDEVKRRIVAQVRRTMPSAIYYAVSGQLTVWLISIFGDSRNVAAVGALSRFAVLLGVVTAVFAALASPRFARIPPEDARRIGRRYVQIQLAVTGVCAIPLLAIVFFSGPALQILGPHYVGLQREVVLMALSGVVATVGGAAFSLGAARGVVAPPQLVIPYSLALQIGLLLVFPVGTVAGVIWVGLLSALAQWLLHVGYFAWQLRHQVEAIRIGDS